MSSTVWDVLNSLGAPSRTEHHFGVFKYLQIRTTRLIIAKSGNSIHLMSKLMFVLRNKSKKSTASVRKHGPQCVAASQVGQMEVGPA
jgi:hypothetical protein